MPSYKLYYFHVRAKGEVCRLSFAAAKVEFEDIRLNGEEWTEMKKSGKPPLGQVPFLETPDGQLLAQSGAIAKYICKMKGLCPEDRFEEAKADMICDGVNDLTTAFLKFYFEKDEEKKGNLQTEFFETTLPARLKCYEALLESAGKEYFTSNKLTYCDITFFQLFNGFLGKGKLEVPDVLSKFPLLVDHYNRVMNTPGIKEWLEKRPQSDL